MDGVCIPIKQLNIVWRSTITCCLRKASEQDRQAYTWLFIPDYFPFFCVCAQKFYFGFGIKLYPNQLLFNRRHGCLINLQVNQTRIQHKVDVNQTTMLIPFAKLLQNEIWCCRRDIPKRFQVSLLRIDGERVFVRSVSCSVRPDIYLFARSEQRTP
jgi:hypothetical protein